MVCVGEGIRNIGALSVGQSIANGNGPGTVLSGNTNLILRGLGHKQVVETPYNGTRKVGVLHEKSRQPDGDVWVSLGLLKRDNQVRDRLVGNSRGYLIHKRRRGERYG